MTTSQPNPYEHLAIRWDPNLPEQFKTVVCGPGWATLIADLVESTGDDFLVSQIKEKFGGLRYYVRPADGLDEHAEARGRQMIDDAERASCKTCETCGAPGEKTQKGHIHKTVCEECR